MTRGARFAASAGVAVAVWLLLLLDILPLPLISHEAKHEILPALPWWVLVSTGAYLLCEVGIGLYNFNDVPKAYDDLMLDIQNAKVFLGARGVHLD